MTKSIMQTKPSFEFGSLNILSDFTVAYQRDMSLSIDYSKEYFNKYISYENTEISKKLNEFRTHITSKYCNSVLDIGIGSGEFIKKYKNKTFGYDINPYAITMLKEKDIYLDPYSENLDDIDGFTMWDVLEHIKNPDILLNKIPKNKIVIVSIPVFDNILKVKQSKHYRPNEHYYYYTINGLISFFSEMNYIILEVSDQESVCGRENIMSFVFQKKYKKR
tara:strand:- start:7989 stop:8648 length:660 start_codon:yes stop_codon:yes gene_type:complete